MATPDTNRGRLELVPVTLRQAQRFINLHHSHNKAPRGARLVVGVAKDGELVGVATAGHPLARVLMDGRTLEVTRVCTLRDRNVCSMLYGALARAAKAIGYRKLITYTLAREAGVALKATGWQVEAEGAGGGIWPAKHGASPHRNLFGEEQYDAGPKTRWSKDL